MSVLPLPHPPSVNRYWRHNRGRTHISREGMAYRERVADEARGVCYGKQRLAMCVHWHPPDNRRRDIDNILKALLDSLACAGVYDDDSQIHELRVVRRGVIAGGRVVVGIEIIA